MTIAARAVFVRTRPVAEPGRTEGTSRLLADDAAAELPRRPEDLDDEQPSDIGLSDDEVAGEEGEPQELASYDLDDLEPDRQEPEVQDTPSDDAMIAAARIELFDEAHRGVAPVDVGPFVEKEGRS